MSHKPTADAVELMARAIQFRAALEAFMNRSGQNLIPSFPEGACTMVCKLLSKWLASLGYTKIEYLQGASRRLSENASHGWLVVDDLIVDITADQFGEEAVIVNGASAFHNTFIEPQRFDAASGFYPSGTEMAEKYDAILQGIKCELPDEAS